MAERESGQDAPRGAKVAIIGAGLVGSTSAYSIVARGLAAEIVLVDVDRDKAEGEAMDICHALSFCKPTRVMAGDYADVAGSDIVVITAGIAQKAGQTRLDLAQRNVDLFEKIIPRVEVAASGAILLIVANPVDILTYATLKRSSYPMARVIGSGTLLDTSRFRYELAHLCGVSPHNVHAYIIGEHGDSEVPVWSLANVAGMRLRDHCPVRPESCTEADLDALFQNVKNAAYRIIERKGATYYAIAMGVARLIEAILRDERTVLTVSTLIDGVHGIRDVCLSLPTLIGRGGVLEALDLALSDDERAGLTRSAATLRRVLDLVGL